MLAMISSTKELILDYKLDHSPDRKPQKYDINNVLCDLLDHTVFT